MPDKDEVEAVKLELLEKNKSPENQEDYDPHEYRKNILQHPTSNLETLIHLLKGALGTGILAMPEAFMNAGLLVGTLGTLFIGFLCAYCLHLLVKAQYVLCKNLRVPLLTYPDSMREALLVGPECLKKFAKCSVLVVDIFLIVYQLGVCCVYIVFCATNIKQLADYYGTEMSLQLHILCLLIPLILINSIRNLKLLAPFSLLANLITFAGFAIVLYYVFRDFDLESEESGKRLAGTFYAFPLFVGTTLFAMESIGVMIALENNMKTPKAFLKPCGVLNVGMGLVTLMYFAMGFFGYWRYGEKSLPSITLNLPQDDILANCVRGLFCLAIYISYALQCYVPVECIWNNYMLKRLENSNKKLLWEYALRIGLVLVTFLLALAIPRLGLFISLFGAFCLSALGIAFPALMDICVRWSDSKFGPCWWIYWKDIILIICGIFGLLSGTYSSISEIIISFLPKGDLDKFNSTTTTNY